MATPHVFVSSTCYDLRYIRENLKFLIKTIGYDAILSEDGSVFYDPRINTLDACIAEVPNAQLFVLIIGGRFGTEYKGTGKSISNTEWREAVKHRIPVFALVENEVLANYRLYKANVERPGIDVNSIKYPAADSIAIFQFIDEVRQSAVNNALVPFKDFGDIETYLRLQWAGMMHSFLTQKNESERVADMLQVVTDINQRIEAFSRELVRASGSTHAQISVELYDLMLTHEVIRDISFMNLRPTPVSVLIYQSFRQCVKGLGGKVAIEEDVSASTIAATGDMTRRRFVRNSDDYKALRGQIIDHLKKRGITPEEYVKESGVTYPKVADEDEGSVAHIVHAQVGM